MRYAVLLLVLAVGFPSLGVAEKKPKQDKKKKPVVFVLNRCQVTEEVDVLSAEGKPTHTKIICECSMRSQKLDAKTGKTVIECQ